MDALRMGRGGGEQSVCGLATRHLFIRNLAPGQSRRAASGSRDLSSRRFADARLALSLYAGGFFRGCSPNICSSVSSPPTRKDCALSQRSQMRDVAGTADFETPTSVGLFKLRSRPRACSGGAERRGRNVHDGVALF